MGLKDKAARIDLSQVGKTTSSPRLAVTKTGIGLHADALFRDEKLAEENKQLQSRLAEFDDAKPARQLKPSMVHASKWANRHLSRMPISSTSNARSKVRVETFSRSRFGKCKEAISLKLCLATVDTVHV